MLLREAKSLPTNRLFMCKLVMKSLLLIAAVVLLVGALPSKFEATLLGADNPPTPQESVQFFKDKVRPILTQSCYPCHTDTEMGHLRVDSREGLLKGGGRGPAIVPGDPEKSLLIEAVRQTGALKMPLNGKLEEQQIADLIAWIKTGAPWEQPEKAESKVPAATAPAEASSAGEDFFETKVRPIFANICSNCHGDAATSGLRVESRESLLKGGSRGPAIVPNDPDKSLMIQAVRQTGELKMPKGGKLTPEEVQSLTDWVKMGAPWPRSKPTITAARGMQFKISPEQRSFWSFKPLKMPATPSVKNGHWARTAIDKFVLAKLESQGIAPSPTADRRTLIRRATFDLTGLPPTPEEIEAFEKDRSPQGFEKVVDRLLASPRYGERWGRHWLDIARYAETTGDRGGGARLAVYPFAWTYRDYVIDAFNKDLSYDRFILEQIAA